MGYETIRIRQDSTSQQIAAGLRDSILRSELLPGEPIRESVLAEELGVSRNSVREAVRILERSGLIDYQMNRGARVREPSKKDLIDLYAARLAIEVGAAEIAPLDRYEEVLVNAFEDLCSALQGGATESAVMADLNFHAEAVGIAGSERLDALFRRILNELQLYLAVLSRVEGEYADPDQVILEHKTLLDAYLGGDRELITQALVRHAEENRGRLERILDVRPSSQ